MNDDADLLRIEREGKLCAVRDVLARAGLLYLLSGLSIGEVERLYDAMVACAGERRWDLLAAGWGTEAP